MANNRVWLVCRGEHEVHDDERLLLAKHFMDGWQRRSNMEEIGPWLVRHEECFFDKTEAGSGTREDPWDHQFALDYER